MIIRIVLLMMLVVNLANAGDLKITIKQDVQKAHVFEVIFSNESEENISFFSPIVGWGRETMQLQFFDENGAVILISPKIFDITGLPLREVEMVSKEHVKYRIDLLDGTWELPALKGDESVQTMKLVYSVPKGTTKLLSSKSVVNLPSSEAYEGVISTPILKLRGSLIQILK